MALTVEEARRWIVEGILTGHLPGWVLTETKKEGL